MISIRNGIAFDSNQKIDRKTATDILLNVKVAIHKLKELGPDYAIWQNANASFKALKKIKKELELIG